MCLALKVDGSGRLIGGSIPPFQLETRIMRLGTNGANSHNVTTRTSEVLLPPRQLVLRVVGLCRLLLGQDQQVTIAPVLMSAPLGW